MKNGKKKKKLENEFKSQSNIEKIDRNSFNIISLIGTGGFSKVWEVKWKKNGMLFAMKEMSKARIIDSQAIKPIIIERNVLSKLNHPFIVNLHFSFQDSDKLYLIMDLVKGKDLRCHLNYLKKMNEAQTKFVIGCIILSLEYIHYHKIVHRDIKPENIILDENGYAKLTDFGLCGNLNKMQARESPGTFSYMAPEVLFHGQSNITIDYYSLGIVTYEFMKGIKPYLEFSVAKTKKYLSENQFSMKRHAVPEGWGIESADFINRLLVKNPKRRLGYNGIRELKNHCWFRGFNFNDLYEFKIKSPFNIKDVKSDIYIRQINNETYKRYKKIMKSHEYKNAFKNFLYFNLYDQNLSKDFLENPYDIKMHRSVITNPDEIKTYYIKRKNDDNIINANCPLNFTLNNYFLKNNNPYIIE